MDWVERAAQLRQWTRGGTRAPHKPLLLLYALSRFQQGADDELRYSAVEEDLRGLLAEYGPGNRTTPAYPFHHLVTDGVWEVRTERGPGSPGPGVRELRATGAAGRLAPELRAALRREPSLLGRMARVLLDLNFPPSLHGELCEAVGLEPEEAETGLLSVARRQRDRRMREMVLTAYEYQCAFCGYDGRIGAAPVGLEAAHVRWWAFDGPDVVENGLCLCSLHHKLFDKGVLGLGESTADEPGTSSGSSSGTGSSTRTDTDTGPGSGTDPRAGSGTDPRAGSGTSHRILVSQSFVGRSAAAREHVVALAGRPLIGPQPGARPVAAAHRAWHTRQVFHGSPRPAATNQA
ncbi:phosphorothioated DNA-binding restriction endonuclease [Streptomyces alfalfae]|uniref:phosphorothioated DNA-binding restriction endonuclease n=1 Tax=Streptomyces alfalfae TaxID=1642299 RepID=UPI001F0A6993|nr:HNH endonuclease [Streptomyces alfalfae]